MDSPPATPTIDPMDTSLGNRFAPYGPTNHSATLWITAILGLIYSFGVLLIRVFIKRRVFGWDDSLIVAGTIVGLVQAIAFFLALGGGLGQTTENVPDLSATGNFAFSSQVLLLVALYFAKVSGVLLLRRLFFRDNEPITKICDVLLGFTILCGVATVVISGAGCPSSGSLVRHCHDQITRWSVITALDIVTEILLLSLPIYLVWQLQMRITYKLRVIAAFCFRILVIIFTALHLSARIKYTKGTPSPFNIVQTLIWHQTLLAWSLISATLPNLQAFLQSLSANWGGADWGYTVKAYGNGTFEMGNMASGAMSSGVQAERGLQGDRKHETQISAHQNGDRASLTSSGSQDMIIRKETAWTVVRS